MSENTQNNTPKKEQYSLNDDRRVKVLSPGAQPVCVTVLITPTCFRTALCPARGKVLFFWVNRSAVCCARHA